MSKMIPALRLIGVGFFIVVCMLLGIFGGLWLDDKLNSKPLFMLGGLIGGLVVATFGVYQMIRPLMNNGQDKETK